MCVGGGGGRWRGGGTTFPTRVYVHPIKTHAHLRCPLVYALGHWLSTECSAKTDQTVM